MHGDGIRAHGPVQRVPVRGSKYRASARLPFLRYFAQVSATFPSSTSTRDVSAIREPESLSDRLALRGFCQGEPWH
jgi:hypothetical protein